jgi:glycosyltransferase involved in cell wall biosynthesis
LSKRNLDGTTDIPPNVKLFFDISKKDLYKKYCEASILLLITHSDDFGDGSDCSGQTVLLDAFATGIPVIATRKSYIRDYAKEGVHLMLVDFYDSSAIIEAIGKITVSGEAMAKNARLLVEQNLSTLKMAEKLSVLFRGLTQ